MAPFLMIFVDVDPIVFAKFKVMLCLKIVYCVGFAVLFTFSKQYSKTNERRRIEGATLG